MLDFSIWRLSAIVFSSLPVLAIAGIFLRIGDRKFSPRLLGTAIAAGAIIAILPGNFSLLSRPLLSGLEPFLSALVTAFGFAGLSEEAAKLAAAYFIVRPHFERRTAADLILGTASVALGFALIENATYVLRDADRWQWVAIARALSAVPMHAMIGLCLGVGLANAERRTTPIDRFLVIFSAWLGAALLHGFYDLPLFLGGKEPLFPTVANRIASSLYLTTPSLLSGAFLLAILAISFRAVSAIRYCEQLNREFASISPGPNFYVSPRWLDAFVFSAWAGIALSTLLATFACFGLIVASGAVLAGALPLGFFQTASAASICLLLSWCLTLPRQPQFWHRPLAFIFDFLLPRKTLASAISIVSLIAIFGFFYFAGVAYKYSVGAVLTASGNTNIIFTDIDGAIKNFTSALNFDSVSRPALFGRARAYHTLQNYKFAIDDLNRMIAIQPDDPGAYALRAKVLATTHDYPNALADFDRSLALDADNTDVLIARASARGDSGQSDRALADIDQVILLKPNLANAHAIRAHIFVDRDEIDRAMSGFNKALQIDPNNEAARFARARLAFGQGNFTEATADLVYAVDKRAGAYATLWLYLARSRNGQDGRRELAFWAGVLPRVAWPFPLIEFYLGLRNRASLYAAAPSEDAKCEADFYVGELLLLQKAEAEAFSFLRRALAKCPKSFVEYTSARAELKRLESRYSIPSAPVSMPNALAPPTPSVKPNAIAPAPPSTKPQPKPADQLSKPPGFSVDTTTPYASPKVGSEPWTQAPIGSRYVDTGPLPTTTFDSYRSRVISRIALQQRYPAEARKRGVEGRATIAFFIGPKGEIDSLSVASSSGDKELDEAALDAVLHAAPFGQPPVGSPRRFEAPINFVIK